MPLRHPHPARLPQADCVHCLRVPGPTEGRELSGRGRVLVVQLRESGGLLDVIAVMPAVGQNAAGMLEQQHLELPSWNLWAHVGRFGFRSLRVHRQSHIGGYPRHAMDSLKDKLKKLGLGGKAKGAFVGAGHRLGSAPTQACRREGWERCRRAVGSGCI